MLVVSVRELTMPASLELSLAADWAPGAKWRVSLSELADRLGPVTDPSDR